mgnify:CR=1 FL=1
MNTKTAVVFGAWLFASALAINHSDLSVFMGWMLAICISLVVDYCENYRGGR